jgi:hypothetical protein
MTQRCNPRLLTSFFLFSTTYMKFTWVSTWIFQDCCYSFFWWRPFAFLPPFCTARAHVHRRTGTIATTQLNLVSSIEILLFGTLEQNQGANPTQQLASFPRLSTGNETSIQQAHERESCWLATFTCGRLNWWWHASSILSKSPGGVKVVIMKSTNEKNGLQLELMANRFGIDDDCH